jgi:hypothetical protein
MISGRSADWFSAPALGAGGHQFKSGRPDQLLLCGEIMTGDEFFSGSQILLRIILFGGLGVISLMVIYTILKSLKADYRTRGFLGLLIGIVKLALFIALIGLLIFVAIANDWLGAIDKFIAGLR